MKKLRITLNGVSYILDVEVLEDDEAGDVASAPSLASTVGPQVAPPPGAAIPQARSVPIPPVGGDRKVLTSPIAGVVAEVNVETGQTVKNNDTVVIIEAMKMKTNINSPFDGRVKDVKVRTGDAVLQNQVLITFE